MKFSERETFLFVKLYISYPCLWDTEHEDNKSRFHREQAYKELISKFQESTNIELDIHDVKVKIKNLRSTYAQEVNKIRERSTSDRTHKPTLKWFGLMHRALRKLSRREIILDDDQQDTEEQKIWVNEDNIDHDNTDLEKDPFVSPTDDDYILLLKSEPQDNIEVREPKYKSKKRKFKQRSPSTDQSEPSRSIVSYDSKMEDEFDIYGKYIASQLRGMDIQRALRVQLQIQSLVSEARIEQMSHGQ